MVERESWTSGVGAAAPAPAVRVLVVDDDALICNLIRRALPDLLVTTVLSACEALARLEQGQVFEVILCDLMMPGMSGVELHVALAQLLPDQARRMIFMTGGSPSLAMREFLTQLTEPWLEKPFDLDHLSLLIARRFASVGRAAD